MLVVWIESVLFGLAYAVDGANIGALIRIGALDD